jgi:serine/threonine-protein kinase RsbW
MTSWAGGQTSRVCKQRVRVMTQLPEQPAQPFTPDEAAVAVPHDRDLVRKVQSEIMAAVERHKYPKASLFAISLSLEEAMANAFNHGHKHLPPTVTVTVRYRVTDENVFLSVQDQGPGFKPEDVPDPTLDENIERTSGRGIMLIRAYMSQVEYREHGKRLDMTYRRPG